MGWLTVDRALTLAEKFGRRAGETWAALRDEIAEEVIEKGWNADVESYTAAYDGSDLDAATLHIGLSGLIDPQDERFAATVLATERELRSGSTVYGTTTTTDCRASRAASICAPPGWWRRTC